MLYFIAYKLNLTYLGKNTPPLQIGIYTDATAAAVQLTRASRGPLGIAAPTPPFRAACLGGRS